jgi:hypothetical protein
MQLLFAAVLSICSYFQSSIVRQTKLFRSTRTCALGPFLADQWTMSPSGGVTEFARPPVELPLASFTAGEAFA